jgi:hypothetical protein
MGGLGPGKQRLDRDFVADVALMGQRRTPTCRNLGHHRSSGGFIRKIGQRDGMARAAKRQRGGPANAGLPPGDKRGG